MPEKNRCKTGRFRKGQLGNPAGRPRGTKNQATLAISEFAREFLASERYRENLKKRILAGKAPTLEVLLHRYAWGPPKEADEVVGAGGSDENVILIDVRRELERGNGRLP